MRSARSTLDALVKSRFVVTLINNEGAFSGVLTEITGKSLTFENCLTVSRSMSEPAEQIEGRLHVFVDRIAYLQELHS